MSVVRAATATAAHTSAVIRYRQFASQTIRRPAEYLSPWLIGTVRAEPETVISRAWVQSSDPAELIVSRLPACML